jgi:class 3 adenylate cyclase
MAETQRVRFATTDDGVNIAYLTRGEGAPLLIMPSWVSHLEKEREGPQGQFNDRLAQNHKFTVYDGRGTGLSDRRVTDFSVQARLRDLEAVVEQLELERFSIFAASQSTPVAMMYAADHPERIERLVLFAAFCGSSARKDHETGLIDALLALIRAEWGVGARTTMGFVHPDADHDELTRNLDFLRAAATGDVAANILEEGFLRTDVRDYLPRIQAPTLVLHRRDDQAVPSEFGRQVASLIPNARFVLLDGNHHLPYEGDVEPVLRAMEEFLDVERTAPPTPRTSVDVGEAPVVILFTDMESSTELTQRLGDQRAQELIRTHNKIVRNALRINGGNEIKHTGDGIMASFVSPSRALESSIQIQRALAQHNQDHPDAVISIRIGLNAGEPVREQNDLFGQAVQLASRICNQAEPGQVLASNVVRELVAGKGFLFADRGTADLRGFEDPVRLYEVRWQD